MDFPGRDRGQQTARLFMNAMSDKAQKRALHLQISLAGRDRERVMLAHGYSIFSINRGEKSETCGLLAQTETAFPHGNGA